MKRKKIIRIIITCWVFLVVLAGAAEVTKRWRGGKEKHSEEYETVNVMDETDSGEPTGDDPWLVLEKLVQTYYGRDEQVSYQGSMLLKDGNEGGMKLLEKLDFEFSLFKGNFHYTMGQQECVVNEQLILLVNHEEKSIAISTTNMETEHGLAGMADFKKILGERNAEAKVTQNGKDKIVTINNIEDPMIQGYQIYYDPVTYRIRKMIIGMIRLSPLEGEDELNSGGGTAGQLTEEEIMDETVVQGWSYYLEINYDKTAVTLMKDEQFHPENKFIKLIGDKANLTPAYSQYTLLD